LRRIAKNPARAIHPLEFAANLIINVMVQVAMMVTNVLSPTAVSMVNALAQARASVNPSMNVTRLENAMQPLVPALNRIRQTDLLAMTVTHVLKPTPVVQVFVLAQTLLFVLLLMRVM